MRVGVIGCGAIATRAHLPAFKSLPNVELQAVADVNEKMARTAAKKFGIPNSYTDYKKMLRDPSIDLVSICTPSPTHTEVAIEAAKNGKHLFIEKPLALTVRGAQMILNMAKENNVKLCVVHNYRYFPAMKEVKRRIDLGNLGRIVTIQGIAHTRIPLQWTASTWLYHKGGALDDFGPHLIDSILWLVNSKIEKVCAFGGDFLGKMNCTNYIQILMRFENRTVATADISWLTGRITFALNVHGTGGYISIESDLKNFFFNDPIETHGLPTPLDDLRNLSKKTISLTKKTISGKFFKGALAFYGTIIKEFINSIEKGTKVPVSGEEALQVVAVSEAAKLSLAEDRSVAVKELFVKTKNITG